ncbi:MAG TPA: Gfo/Idh/MocA family oxidoreductase [Candidatus Limnocylindrales bacterium]
MTVTVAVVGAGSRGRGYAEWVAQQHPDRVRVVAVAEPNAVRRERFAAAHGLPAERVFADWRDLLAGERIADCVLVCTQDSMHREPVLRAAELGYHIMVEKPLAPTERDCRDMVEAVEKAGVIFAVGHVLRYTPYTRTLKSVVDSGRLGEIMSVQHLEPVGYWHQAHSFVRGNWRNEAESTFMLMAKSCHDLDWLQHVVGQPIARVASFGSRSHFTAENRPSGAADRCLDCPAAVESNCAFSAVRFYGRRLAEGRHHWPLSVIVEDFTQDALHAALRDGPYGRCVYACDNDVVDHQVAILEFAGGATATFTMTGFSELSHRRTRIFGTRGELEGNGEALRVFDFLSDTTEVIDALEGDPSAAGGHGGGDEGLMEAFVAAVESGDRSSILSGPQATLNSHLAVFAAERARRSGSVQDAS